MNLSYDKKLPFTGVATALVTPFDDGGQIDFEAFGQLIDFNISGGVNALVVAGTTGEAPVLDDSEFSEFVKFAAEKSSGRVPVIAGCGSNNTKHAERLAKIAVDAGCDGLLCVTPYYNKANSEGLVRHFLSVADRTDKPVILYNVPSRTGCSIPLEVYDSLVGIANIVGIKEASGNIAYAEDILSRYGRDFAVYSGNDDMTLPLLSLGAVGVISVVSNLMPRDMYELYNSFVGGNIDRAAWLQIKMIPLIRELFREVNPIPIKTALFEVGKIKESFRLPLCKMSADNRKRLCGVLNDLHMI